MDHIREYMRETYGSDNCLRKSCDELVAFPDGYCTTHHTEWIHGENAHNLQAQYTDRKE